MGAGSDGDSQFCFGADCAVFVFVLVLATLLEVRDLLEIEGTWLRE